MQMNEWSKPNNEEINCKQFCSKASIFGFCVVHCDCEPFMSFKYSSLDVYNKQITAWLVRLYDFSQVRLQFYTNSSIKIVHAHQPCMWSLYTVQYSCIVTDNTVVCALYLKIFSG
jgi:hypothetical protein